MDEAEKYKQRLEAIAEKRRLQEEEDKARREMEDEKLRLQQLKRKSLRDQWLMEGAPLSPRSPDAQAPRSPSWDMKKDAEKLQLEEEPTEQEVVNLAEDGEDMVRGVVQNGSGDHEGTAEGKVKLNARAAPDEAVVPSINGNLEPCDNHSASTTNGPVGGTAAVGGVKLDQQSSGDEPEPDRPPNDQINEEEEEEEEGTLVMRAECVIITDEGDEASQEDHQDDAQHQSLVLDAEEEEEEEEGVVESVKTKTAAESEKDEAAEDGDGGQSGVKLVPNGGGAVEDGDIQVGSMASVQLQSSAGALEGAVVASVPVYCEGEPSPPPPPSAAAGEREAEAAEGVQAALRQAGSFQEVSLTDPQDNNRTKEGGGKGEGEPLLSGVPVPGSTAEPAGVYSPASTETQSPARAQDQAPQDKGPKRKTCQCCSVM